MEGGHLARLREKSYVFALKLAQVVVNKKSAREGT